MKRPKRRSPCFYRFDAPRRLIYDFSFETIREIKLRVIMEKNER